MQAQDILRAITMKWVITISGLHGTGKSSVADIVAKRFGLKRVSAGVIFRELAKKRGLTLEEFSIVAEDDESIDRELDALLKTTAMKGNVLLDGQLAGWMAGDYANFKILLTASVDARVKRIAERDEVSLEHARRETLNREKSERERYLEFYGVDISDQSIYDLVLNTEKYDLQGVIKVLTTAIETFLEQSSDTTG
ncbi:MAG: cytidylate kinase [Candidatus Thorarchaeota archaeon]|nr:MAG: cytidylate kinase [Candidatus Thorarchaeota archaeon]